MLVFVEVRAWLDQYRASFVLAYSEMEWTMVLGYFRWLNKGAKPEYVGVT
jgi:hypothetical protein